MSRGRAGWAVAAAGFVVAAAVGLVVWLAMEPGTEGERSSIAAAADRRIEDSSEAKPLRRAASAGDAPAATVEIDDAPLSVPARGTIRGTVRDDLGQPVAGARVGANKSRPYGDVWFHDVVATTGDDATYAIKSLDPAIVWHLVAEADGHVGAQPAKTIVMSANRLDVTCDLVVTRCGSVKTTVLDTAGSPLAHSVDVLPLDGDSSRSPREDEIPPGRWRVFVEAEGHAGDSRVVDVAAGETTGVEFRLGEEVEITGVVLDSDGTPVDRVGVVAVAADPALAPFDGTTRSARDGSFRIGGLRRTHYRLALADWELSADVPEPLLAPASGATLRLRDFSRVTFHLVYPPGFSKTDRSAEVEVTVSNEWHGTKPSPRWDGDQGTVRIPGGEEVDLTILVVRCAPWFRRVRARPGEVLDIGDVRPEVQRDIEGCVVDAAGSPIRDARVRYGEGRFGGVWDADRSGWFQIARVPQFDCVLSVQAPGFVAKRVDCRADDTAPLTVKLERGGLLWVRAASPVGGPLAAAAVRIDDGSGTAWWAAPTALDDRGECAVRLAPGRWRISVAGCAPAEADVREGATTTVRIAAAR